LSEKCTRQRITDLGGILSTARCAMQDREIFTELCQYFLRRTAWLKPGKIGAGRYQRFAEGFAQRNDLRMIRDANRQRVKNNQPADAISSIVDVLKKEHVIAYPTEAVFGVGCDPDSETAVKRLLELKQRPMEKGLILIAANFEQLKPYIDDAALTPEQREAVFACWPGPVTFVFPAKASTPRWLTGRFNSLAVRVTNHPQVIAIR